MRNARKDPAGTLRRECVEHKGTQAEPEGRASWRQSVLKKNERIRKAEADQAAEGVYRDYNRLNSMGSIWILKDDRLGR